MFHFNLNENATFKKFYNYIFYYLKENNYVKVLIFNLGYNYVAKRKYSSKEDKDKVVAKIDPLRGHFDNFFKEFTGLWRRTWW